MDRRRVGRGERPRVVVTIVVIAALAAAAYLGWRRWTPDWPQRPMLGLGVAIVDYTVPFENYREHAGVVWILNHVKVRTPDESPAWLAAQHYHGYSPLRRDRPVRLHQLDLAAVDLVYISDTYGVYRDDLRQIDEQVAHMDYSPLVFGGLSVADGQALTAHVGGGGTAIAEFNTFCEPTTADVRAQMEALFGLQWTEWVARVFADPGDTEDVPHWFPREFERQFPDRPFPSGPVLVLVSRTGTLQVFEGARVADIAPRVHLTATGQQAFPTAQSGAPYYYWFSIMRPTETTTVHAEMALPAHAELTAALVKLGLPTSPPAMTEALGGGGRAIYFAGDFGEPDFDPGRYDSDDAIIAGQHKVGRISGVTQAPVFWSFYAPVAAALVRQLAAAKNQ